MVTRLVLVLLALAAIVLRDDSGPEDTLAGLGLAESDSRIYWTRGGVAETAGI